jgi:uncharacterized protein (DUF779 family)
MYVNELGDVIYD